MEQMENPPGKKNDSGRTVEAILQTMTQDLKHLHEGLVSQLSQEVSQLQSEKARLSVEVATLKTQHQALQAQQSDALTQQQIAQQQLWAKQLAMALASHLQGLMVQQVNQIAKANQLANGGVNLPGSSLQGDQAHRMLVSLDAAFNATFKTLQQELTSYQSSLSEQLNRMHTMEQQGEAILAALMSRLRDQLQADSANPSQAVPPRYENGNPAQSLGYAAAPTDRDAVTAQSYSTASNQGYSQPLPSGSYSAPGQSPITGRATPLAMPASPLSPPPSAPAKKEFSTFWVGFFLVLISTIALSVHNVAVRVIAKSSSILGLPDLGGFINVTILGNSLLILWLRMLVVLPLMVIVAIVLYPPVWRDLRKFATSRDRRSIMAVVGSGVFLFLSQVLIYIAIGQLGAGPAVTILFMYPIVTVPLAWLLFNDRPTPLRWAVMGTILFGVFLTAIPNIATTGKGFSLGGVAVAIGSGVAFALYLIFMQLGFKKLHPVPVSLVQFFTIFVLSSAILIGVGPDLGTGVDPDKRLGFVIGGIILGALTLVGYLTNNFGVRFMGAGLASIIASIGPVMTALLAWILIKNQLQGVQWFGILFVTLGVGALSFERMKLQRK